LAKPIGVPDRARPILSGEFGAALTAACCQDGAAGAGTHAKAETVHLGATAVVWLERSLAHKSISMKADVARPRERGAKHWDAQWHQPIKSKAF